MTSPDPVGSPRLHRGLWRVDVIALTFNVIFGAGVFAMPAGLAAAAGRRSTPAPRSGRGPRVLVITAFVAYGWTSAALIVLRRREGPAPVLVSGGTIVAVAALLCCVAIVLTTSWLAVRDVAIMLAIGLALRTWVRRRTEGRRLSGPR